MVKDAVHNAYRNEAIEKTNSASEACCCANIIAGNPAMIFITAINS
jgi:hypothetical protein